uniref:Uncharacterized protein n=1 Tax=Sphaerodactylus townsendi TaxID=933632 RepID=A0ACB8FEG7_9SAUR
MDTSNPEPEVAGSQRTSRSFSILPPNNLWRTKIHHEAEPLQILILHKIIMPSLGSAECFKSFGFKLIKMQCHLLWKSCCLILSRRDKLQLLSCDRCSIYP